MEKVTFILIFVGLVVGLACEEIPCRLYDVTTVYEQDVYKVHSRTNAVGLPTSFSSFTGREDPLESSKLTCYFNKTEVCTGWKLNGFEMTSWRHEDLFLDWKRISRGSRSEYYLQARKIHKDFFPYESRFPAYTFRLKVTSTLKNFFIGSYDPITGLEFNYNSSTATYQEKRFRRTYSNYIDEEMGTLNGTVTLVDNPEFITVSLTGVGNEMCISLENLGSSSGCVFKFFRNGYFSVVYGSSHPDSEGFYNDEINAMQLTGSSGSATIASSETTSSGQFCLSLRYFLKKGERGQIKFIADASREILYSGNLQGTGKIVSQQFSMIIRDHQQGQIQISFETGSATSFMLRSARKCSAADRDVIISNQLNGCTSEYGNPGLKCWYHNDRTWDTVNGTTIRCPDSPFPIVLESGSECHHGGISIDGFCQCLPGFTGPTCEKACPPGRFGADCNGGCVSDPHCKGVFLAGPNMTMECARGFEGLKCDQPCQSGFYGPGCRLECGKCLHGTCDRFSGLCNGPCKQGFRNRTCQYQLAAVDGVRIDSSSFNSADVSVDITSLNDVDMKNYPFIKIWYHLERPELSQEVHSKFLPTTSRNIKFQLDHLDHGETYKVYAALIHDSGDFYHKPSVDSVFATDCNVGSFGKVDIVSTETLLNVSWEVFDHESYPCHRTGYYLEIYLPEIERPLRKLLSVNITNATIEYPFPRYGSFRLGATYYTRDKQWSYHDFSNSGITEVLRKFDIKDKTTRSIDFSWSSSDGMAEDIIVCKPEPVLCSNQQMRNHTQTVRQGEFTLKGLSPFTTYKCSLQISEVEASTITEQDQPTGSPKPHIHPVIATNTTASIQWKDPDCLTINGIPRGFRVELWRGGVHEATVTTTDTTLQSVFSDLLPETSYEAKVYVVNQLGWNAAKFLSIPFKTKSTTPNAVKDLLVFKRTRNEMWIRWSPPESDTPESVVIAYKVTASAPGVESQSAEIPPVQCSTWEGYFCYRLRSLVPDMEYTIQVQAKNDKVDLFGPSTVTHAMTKEGVPDPPANVHVHNRTTDSIVLAWEVPLMLNSNPKFFVATLEQTDENNSQEKPTEPTEKKVFINEAKQIYEVKFEQLNVATTYVATISAGLRGQRAMLTVNTPPENPPAPPAPTVEGSPGNRRVIFHGILNKPDSLKLLSGYVLLVGTNQTDGVKHGITDNDVASSIQSQFTDEFFIAHEFAPTLAEEVFAFATEPPVKGNFSLIQNKQLEPNLEYRVALAAISTYCDAHSATVSPVTTVTN